MEQHSHRSIGQKKVHLVRQKKGAPGELSASHLQALVVHVIDVTVLFTALDTLVLRSLTLSLKKVLQISIHK